MNIIVIMSDTFRRDHLGCYGNRNINTPYLDQFSQGCVKFNNCYATSFPTMPNRADLFTGKYAFPSLGWAPLPLEENILAEILQKAGYTTIAVVDTPFLIRDGYGYDRGFKEFVWIRGQILPERQRIGSERRYEEDFFAPKTMIAAEKALEYYYKEKFFVYIDTYDPHEPWDPPHWYVEQYYPGYHGQRCVLPCYWDWREAGLKEEDIKLAHACYCGEITMVDRWIGRLLDKVKSLGLLENTIILFTSDHGFYFGEHGYFGKLRRRSEHKLGWSRDLDKEKQWWCRSPLYQEATRIPLLIYVPGLKSGETEAMVCSVDLMPTILELAEVEVPDSIQGQSLVSVMKRRNQILHDFVVTSLPLYNPGEITKVVDHYERYIREPQPSTITTQKWTLLYSGENSATELYNIECDPEQSKNVFHGNWEVAKDLHYKFIRLLGQIGTEERLLSPRRHLSNT